MNELSEVTKIHQTWYTSTATVKIDEWTIWGHKDSSIMVHKHCDSKDRWMNYLRSQRFIKHGTQALPRSAIVCREKWIRRHSFGKSRTDSRHQPRQMVDLLVDAYDFRRCTKVESRCENKVKSPSHTHLCRKKILNELSEVTRDSSNMVTNLSGKKIPNELSEVTRDSSNMVTNLSGKKIYRMSYLRSQETHQTW